MTFNNPGKNEKWFLTAHLKDDLKNRSIKGGFSTMGAQAISFILNIGSTIIMARLLLPEDYGLVAMVTAVTGFVVIFKDMGLSAAVIQKKDIEQEQVSAVFWINVFISFGIAFIVAALAPVLTHFYNEPRLFQITIVFALSIFLSGVSLQHNALMKRQMKFKSLSIIQIGSTAAGLVFGIGMAWAGYGYWALVGQMVMNSLFYTVALWIACDWRPDIYRKTAGVSSFLKFGAGITGFDLVNYFSRNMDNVLIGKYAGSGALGFYSKAYQLLLLPITQLRDPLNAVALPALSTLQHDPEKYRSYFKRYLFTLAFFCMPLVMYSAIFSDELIFVVLGSNWTPSAYLFKLLAIAAFIQPVASTQGLVLITTGKVRKYFFLGLANAVVMVSGFAIGIQWGAEGVAISYAIVNYLVFLPFLYYCFHGSPLTVALFLKEIAFPLIYALISGAAMFIFRHYLIHWPAIVLCATGFLTGAICYLLPWYSNSLSKDRFKQVLEIGSFLTKK